MNVLLRNKKGAAAVEFGLILPLLLIVVFGTIEFGLILYDQAMITNASREGARAGIVLREPAVSTGDITSVVNGYVTDNMISLGSPGAVSTSVSGDCSAPDTDITVTVSYTYDFLVLPDFVTDLTGPITLTAESIMRCENRL